MQILVDQSNEQSFPFLFHFLIPVPFLVSSANQTQQREFLHRVRGRDRCRRRPSKYAETEFPYESCSSWKHVCTSFHFVGYLKRILNNRIVRGLFDISNTAEVVGTITRAITRARDLKGRWNFKEEERRNKTEENERKKEMWQSSLGRNIGYDTAFFSLRDIFIYFNAVLLHTLCIVALVNNDRES